MREIARANEKPEKCAFRCAIMIWLTLIRVRFALNYHRNAVEPGIIAAVSILSSDPSSFGSASSLCSAREALTIGELICLDFVIYFHPFLAHYSTRWLSRLDSRLQCMRSCTYE